LALGKGDLFEDDSFTISTETSTVRLAQDLVLRLGASRSGEGLESRRSENEASDVIPGLDLEFFAPSKKPCIKRCNGNSIKRFSLSIGQCISQ
jgi:hypothetical protein